MKKKLLIVLVLLVLTGAGLYLGGFFDKGEVTKDDTSQGEETKEAIEDILDDVENIEMPDFEDDTTGTNVVEEEEEFDPEAML